MRCRRAHVELAVPRDELWVVDGPTGEVDGVRHLPVACRPAFCDTRQPEPYTLVATLEMKE